MLEWTWVRICGINWLEVRVVRITWRSTNQGAIKRSVYHGARRGTFKPHRPKHRDNHSRVSSHNIRQLQWYDFPWVWPVAPIGQCNDWLSQSHDLSCYCCRSLDHTTHHISKLYSSFLHETGVFFGHLHHSSWTHHSLQNNFWYHFFIKLHFIKGF